MNFGARDRCLLRADAEPDPSQIELNGRLEAQLVDLAPKVSGRVVAVLVKEGDRVKSGDLLVQLDLGDTALDVERDRHGVQAARARLQDLTVGSREAEIAAAAAEVADRRAAVDLADRELQRQEFLLSKEVGRRATTTARRPSSTAQRRRVQIAEERLSLTSEGFRQWQTAQARSEVDRAQTQLRQSEVVAREGEIRAPADGVVMHRMAEPGQLLAAGQTGITMALANRLYVRTFVPETRLGKVKPGPGRFRHSRRTSRARHSRRPCPRFRPIPSSPRSRSRHETSASTSSTPRRSIWCWAGARRSCRASLQKWPSRSPNIGSGAGCARSEASGAESGAATRRGHTVTR